MIPNGVGVSAPFPLIHATRPGDAPVIEFLADRHAQPDARDAVLAALALLGVGGFLHG